MKDKKQETGQISHSKRGETMFAIGLNEFKALFKSIRSILIIIVLIELQPVRQKFLANLVTN